MFKGNITKREQISRKTWLKKKTLFSEPLEKSQSRQHPKYIRLTIFTSLHELFINFSLYRPILTKQNVKIISIRL